MDWKSGAVEVTAPIRTVSRSNQREHWRVRHRRDKGEKLCVRALLSQKPRPPGPWAVMLERLAPRTMDSDNLGAALKAVRDAVASYLDVDDADGPGAMTSWTYGQRKSGVYGVRIFIKTRDTF